MDRVIGRSPRIVVGVCGVPDGTRGRLDSRAVVTLSIGSAFIPRLTPEEAEAIADLLRSAAVEGRELLVREARRSPPKPVAAALIPIVS